MKEAYIYGCGQCGRDMYLKADLDIESRAPDPETRYVVPSWPDPAPEPCERCAAVITQGNRMASPEITLQSASSIVDLAEDGDLITECVPLLMGWCACGNPETVTALAFQYLTEVDADVRVKDSGLPEETWLLLAYMCDGLEWTEHGGSVGGAWLTDVGKEALRKYAARMYA